MDAVFLSWMGPYPIAINLVWSRYALIKTGGEKEGEKEKKTKKEEEKNPELQGSWTI